MKRWTTKTLGDVCEKITDGSHRTPPFTQQGYPFATVAHVDDDGKIDLASCKRISAADFEELKRNDCRPLPGDVLFSKDGTVGKVALVDFDTDFVVLSSLAILRPNPALLNQRFLTHALRSGPVLGQAINRKSGSAIRRIVLRDLRHVSIPVPPLAEQERIVKLLDEADELRKLRAQADRRTANLIPGLFHEMFGSPATNPYGWPVENVGRLFNEDRYGAKCGPFGSALRKNEYVEAGIPVWGIPNVLPNNFVEAGSLFISENKFESLRAYAVESGDMLISRAGTVGRICVARPTYRNSIIGTNLIWVALEGKRVVPEFFSTLLTYFAKDVGRLRANIEEGAYSFMNTTVLKTFRIYLPPLPLQKEFANRMTEIRELETDQAVGRGRLDDLFQSMLHRAFNGEL